MSISTISSSLAASLVLAAGLAHAGPERTTACDDTKADAACCTKATEITGLAGPATEDLVVTQGAGPDEQSKMVLMTTEDDGSTTKVVIVNGDIDAVTINGKPVPKNRIKKSGDTLSILDEDGKQIASFNIGFAENGFVDDHSQMMSARVGFDVASRIAAQADPEVAKELAMLRANQPKVFMGINLSDPDPSVMDYLGIESAIRVDKVIDDTPAQRAGLQPNDLIIAIDAHDGLSSKALSKILGDKEPGDTITLKVIRKGKRLTLPLTLTKYPTKMGMPQAEMSLQMVPGVDPKTGLVTIQPNIAFGHNNFEGVIEQLRETGTLSERQLKELSAALESYNIASGIAGPRGNRVFGNVRVPGRDRAEQFFTIEPGQTGSFSFSPDAPHAPATEELDRLAERLDRLEQKLDKIEHLLDRLAGERRRGN